MLVFRFLKSSIVPSKNANNAELLEETTFFYGVICKQHYSDNACIIFSSKVCIIILLPSGFKWQWSLNRVSPGMW